jgi:hypothetical protein
VTRFRLPTSFARRYPTCQAGGRDKLELWIPAADLDELNRHLVGPIEVVQTLWFQGFQGQGRLCKPTQRSAARN